jgi:hypothetical protein
MSLAESFSSQLRRMRNKLLLSRGGLTFGYMFVDTFIGSRLLVCYNGTTSRG